MRSRQFCGRDFGERSHRDFFSVQFCFVFLFFSFFSRPETGCFDCVEHLRTTPWGGGGRLRVCKPPPSLAREGRAADSPAGRFDGLRRTHPLCAVSSSSPGLRIQGPGLQNPRGHGLPCAAPGRTVGSSGGLTQSGGCSKRRSIPATVPAAPTPLARSAPPARCPGPISGTIYHVPLLRSPTTTPEPLPLLPLCPTALYHAMLWYTPSMRTRVPSFERDSSSRRQRTEACEAAWRRAHY